ncbi:conserved hypothetical protein [Listeria monocytogenes QOC1]|nr:conserved hypothetical protein [Listeria monocytogenes QOC1]CUL07763.1 hypothetical protein LM701377_10206 [Listeria monocytogenes]CUL84315.1 hypothetical protein LM83088_30065 [Listeria monocytogenes]
MKNGIVDVEATNAYNSAVLGGKCRMKAMKHRKKQSCCRQ